MCPPTAFGSNVKCTTIIKLLPRPFASDDMMMQNCTHNIKDKTEHIIDSFENDRTIV